MGMARAQKLKVYRTVAGFYDAYVAAPSQKAALEAWGSERDLFARGIAELVTDPALMAEPLSSPGTVVKHSRGTTAEQIAALPEPTTRAKPVDAEPDTDDGSRSKPRTVSKPKPKPKPPPKPKPKRDEIDAAEAAFDALKADLDRKTRDLVKREAALARERRALEQERSAGLQDAEDKLNKTRRAYDDALRAWRTSQD
jgi:hypothetical protein